ncbi:hypothetical protein XENOCAPTIV_020878, partial [Xenoophorus captivus]
GAAPDTEPAEHPSMWESKIKTWMERYEEASSNQYSEDVQVLLRVKEQGDGKNLAYNTHPTSFKPPKNKKILKAVRDLPPDSLIIEYRGKFMLRQQFEANGYFFKRPTQPSSPIYLSGRLQAGRGQNSKRKSFSRNRTHIGQQRRRARTISTCSDLTPSSPAEPVEPPASEAPEGEIPSAPEPEVIPSHWVGEKQQDRAAVRTPEPVPDRPLRISSDPEVLATQLNALPGMTCSPQVYSTPKHYVRFSSPFLANRSPTTPGRWLKQALEEEGSTSPARRPSLFLPGDGPLSPSVNGDADSPLLYNGTCSLPGWLFVADRPPSLVSSPCVRPPVSDGLASEVKVSLPESPQLPAPELVDCVEERTDGGLAENSNEALSSAETCTSSFSGWIKSPDRGPTGPAGLNFSPVNSNLRDLTPSHTLEPLAALFRPEPAAGTAAAPGAGSLSGSQPPFSEAQGQLFYPCSEEGSSLVFSRSLNGDNEGGSAQNPPQRKKTPFLQLPYLNLKCAEGTSELSPVSTVPPVTVEAFPVALEPTIEPPLPSAPCNSTPTVKEPQPSEESEASGEKEGGEGQW